MCIFTGTANVVNGSSVMPQIHTEPVPFDLHHRSGTFALFHRFSVKHCEIKFVLHLQQIRRAPVVPWRFEPQTQPGIPRGFVALCNGSFCCLLAESGLDLHPWKSQYKP